MASHALGSMANFVGTQLLWRWNYLDILANELVFSRALLSAVVWNKKDRCNFCPFVQLVDEIEWFFANLKDLVLVSCSRVSWFHLVRERSLVKVRPFFCLLAILHGVISHRMAFWSKFSNRSQWSSWTQKAFSSIGHTVGQWRTKGEKTFSWNEKITRNNTFWNNFDWYFLRRITCMRLICLKVICVKQIIIFAFVWYFIFIVPSPIIPQVDWNSLFENDVAEVSTNLESKMKYCISLDSFKVVQ